MSEIESYAAYMEIDSWWRRQALLRTLSALDRVFITHHVEKMKTAPGKPPAGGKASKPVKRR